MSNLTQNKAVAEVEVLTDELILSLLENVTKSTTIAVEYEVDEPKSRQSKGVKLLQKRVRVNTLYLNHDYGNKVRNKTGNSEFEAEQMKGKTRITSTIIESNKNGNKLLDGKIENYAVVTRLHLLHKGEEISELEAIAQNLFAPAYFDTTPKKTSGRGQVDVDDDFQMLTIGISNIKYLKCFGKAYAR